MTVYCWVRIFMLIYGLSWPIESEDVKWILVIASAVSLSLELMGWMELCRAATAFILKWRKAKKKKKKKNKDAIPNRFCYETAEEANKAFKAFCHGHHCATCPLYHTIGHAHCMLKFLYATQEELKKEAEDE